jgi:hypothetical protein
MTHTVDAVRDRNKTSIRTDWRSFFAYIKTNVPAESNAYLFNLVPVDRWSPPRFYAQRFYYQKQYSQPAALYRENHLLPHYTDAEEHWQSDVLIVTPYGHQSIQNASFKDMGSIVVLEFDRMSVIHIRRAADMRRRVRRVFERLAARLEATENHYRVFVALAWMRFNDGDTAGAREMVSVLSQLDERGELDAPIITPLEAAIGTDD